VGAASRYALRSFLAARYSTIEREARCPIGAEALLGDFLLVE
jgi:hypothetical protein